MSEPKRSGSSVHIGGSSPLSKYDHFNGVGDKTYLSDDTLTP